MKKSAYKTMQPADLYDESFYEETHEKRICSAAIILPIVLEALPPVHSVVDVGCGQGAWLSVLKNNGVSEIHGVDGEWIKDGDLVIPPDCFRAANMESGEIDFDRRYDMAMSLEVAEHLPPEAADNFVRSLTRASDFVLFSAAIPFQGGTNHINEQWPEYWRDLFLNRDYVALDFIRGQIWDNNKVNGCYRQNTLLYAAKKKAGEIKSYNTVSPLSIVMPGSYMAKVEAMSRRKTKIAKLRNKVNIALITGLMIGLAIGFGL